MICIQIRTTQSTTLFSLRLNLIKGGLRVLGGLYLTKAAIKFGFWYTLELKSGLLILCTIIRYYRVRDKLSLLDQTSIFGHRIEG